MPKVPPPPKKKKKKKKKPVLRVQYHPSGKFRDLTLRETVNGMHKDLQHGHIPPINPGIYSLGETINGMHKNFSNIPRSVQGSTPWETPSMECTKIFNQIPPVSPGSYSLGEPINGMHKNFSNILRSVQGFIP